MVGIARKYVCILCLLFLVSCQKTAESGNEFELVFQASDSHVAEQLARELDNSGVPYRRDGSTTFWYSEKDYELVRELSRKVILEDIPSNRSISFSDSAWNQVLIEEFEKAGIAYEIKTRNGKEWIVWEEKYASAGAEIVNDIKSQASRSKSP